MLSRRPTGPIRHLLGFRRTMAMVTTESGSRGPVETAVHRKLTTLLKPSRLTITNDSHLHRHHAAMRAQGGGSGETHFAVQIISEAFEGKSTLQRHRLVYSALSDELAQGLHALSLKTATPLEAQQLAVGQAE
ncbi:bola-like protein-domain-containing protein [Boletus edulis BED1]|uniref:Bola-like protein-domain-containing protein n=1 Tax=Boletus edulis BED1 TaxID=1328754 RepID=A0AAD4BWQ6_BOLED|nr:bola-like protein-domain-containing protein [Boletus edulis BED1]